MANCGAPYTSSIMTQIILYSLADHKDMSRNAALSLVLIRARIKHSPSREREAMAASKTKQRTQPSQRNTEHTILTSSEMGL